jgi:hypothetical protein
MSDLVYYYLILPMVGFKPNVPLILDGILMLPPKSLPNPRIDAPLAKRAPSPPEEPPGLKSLLCGFLVTPNIGLLQSELKVRWEFLVTPNIGLLHAIGNTKPWWSV